MAIMCNISTCICIMVIDNYDKITMVTDYKGNLIYWFYQMSNCVLVIL